MDPEYLTSDSTYAQKQMQQEKIAMAYLWATRAGLWTMLKRVK